MTKFFSNKLVVAISSRALFDLDESNQIYEKQGIEAYRSYQLENEKEILKPGAAFSLVQKFLKLNEGRNEKDALVEVLLLSRNTADTGLRIFHSLRHYGLNVIRAAFAGGKSPFSYAKAFGADLFLSLNPQDVRQALEAGCAAATIWPADNTCHDPNGLNIAFDGDAVLFSDEAERVFKTKGLLEFNLSEQNAAHQPLAEGPFKGFLLALQSLQRQATLPIPIRTALVTARSAPAHERVIRTLRQWDIRLDESLFLGGLPKADFLAAFKADVFFDDQKGHCENASQKVTSGHVPYGVANE
ncbi:MAG: 5'-nucleotidase [Gammaproteobacteria bacterium 39-13]|nr:5'-nucleotidase [Gammaproteobacteria bacterium]OJV94919.1 MAG: 5'-nucleotidase [Gammaproteobacteria bacterium 39-13]